MGEEPITVLASTDLEYIFDNCGLYEGEDVLVSNYAPDDGVKKVKSTRCTLLVD